MAASNQTNATPPGPSVLHQMMGAKSSTSKGSNTISGDSYLPGIVLAGMILLGVATGYVAYNVFGGTLAGKPSVEQSPTEANAIVKGKVYGSPDEKSFKDSAEGTVEEGGLDGEGSHHLVRPGGDSQTAYLTSSSVDLNQFVGKKVKVWGQTFKAQKSGWFMDVGRLEVLE